MNEGFPPAGSPGSAPAAASSSGTPAAGSVAPSRAGAPKRRLSLLQVLTGVLLVVSIVGNGVLLVAVIALVAALAGGVSDETYLERVLEAGPSSRKIAVVSVDGVIEEGLVGALSAQIRRASEDPKVKAVILRIDSPGGGLTASDMLHNEIQTRLVDHGKPVVAAMQSVAASGGYYVACAADDIMAQQTTVTGSIGVIAQFFFLNTLMKDKLGVTPVTLKVGEQKDWPNLFAAEMTEAQRQYFLDTLLKPGYDRFVDVVAEGRAMDRDQVVALATGRIFLAPEAREKGLVDHIGYFEDAVALARQRAGLKDARVIEYVQPFRFGELFGATAAKARALVDLAPERLAALATPRIMYLWTGF